MVHQADGRLLHHRLQRHQEIEPESMQLICASKRRRLLCGQIAFEAEVVGEEVVDFHRLFFDRFVIDEEARTHLLGI